MTTSGFCNTTGSSIRTDVHSLSDRVDLYRLDASRLLDAARRSQMGQFFTPSVVARFMASLFGSTGDREVRLLDAGAGVGSLTAAFTEEMCKRPTKPSQIHVTAYELDPLLAEFLGRTLDECQHLSRDAGIPFAYTVKQEDFIRAGSRLICRGLFDQRSDRVAFTHAILNPPYRKIRSDSEHRVLLRSFGVETTNLYAGFVSAAIRMMQSHGELVAITPRSFCNGPYFKPFRELLLRNVRFRRIHVFQSRDLAFKDDDVLQENIIFHAVKGGRCAPVAISASLGPDFGSMTLREVEQADIVRPDDRHKFIHIATTTFDQSIVDRVNSFGHSLQDIGIRVSTGRVVDFRARRYLRQQPEPSAVPLIYPLHFNGGFISWPRTEAKKPNAIVLCSGTRTLVFPAGHYTVARRFSSKEEPRRIVPAVYDPECTASSWVAFENHLNVYHRNNAGLSPELARGLAVFLGSTLIDIYFRQFNGHTQVNATDLRALRYPSLEVLERIGQRVQDIFPSQDEIDMMIEKELELTMAQNATPDPVRAAKRIEEALAALKALDLPPGQHNERSALALLALLQLKPGTQWSEAESRPIGITPMMEFAAAHYGRQYAPNSRETFRRFTIHQFVQAGLVIENPDDPQRPVNSPKWCYQIEDAALNLLRTYKTALWNEHLAEYREKVESLRKRYAREREMKRVPVVVAEDTRIQLTLGKHSELIKLVIEEFAPRFTPGGEVIYVGDTGEKWGYFQEETLRELGVNVDSHGKMPDVVIYYPEKSWLLLVEAVTSHGPVDSKRRDELAEVFRASQAPLVYVTAFPTRAILARYISEISWETEVWVAENPTHLIHFNGERFLGPYASDAND